MVVGYSQNQNAFYVTVKSHSQLVPKVFSNLAMSKQKRGVRVAFNSDNMSSRKWDSEEVLILCLA